MVRQIVCMTFALGWGVHASFLAAQSFDSQFRSAAEAYLLKDWATAAEQFERIAVTHPQHARSADAWFFSGEARMQLRDWPMAQVAFQHFLTRNTPHPSREKTRFRLAEIAYLRNDIEGVRQCEAFVAEYPDSWWRPQVLLMLGELRLQRSEPQLAERVFAKAIRQYPRSEYVDRYRLGLAEAAFRMNQFDSARSHLEALLTAPLDATGLAARLLDAQIDLRNNCPHAARTKLLELSAGGETVSSRHAEIQLWLGRASLAIQEFDSAEKAFQVAISSATDPSIRSQACLDWVPILVRKKAYLEALTRLDELLMDVAVAEWHEPAMAAKIRILFESGESATAATAVAEYRDRFPAGANAALVREIAGHLAYQRHDFPTSCSEFLPLVNEFQSRPEMANLFRYYLGMSLAAAGEATAAKNHLRQVDPGRLDGPANELCALTLAECQLALQEYSQAAQDFRSFLQNYPDSNRAATARQRCVEIALVQSDYQALLQYWPETQRELKADETAWKYWRGVADLAFQNQDWALATDGYRKLAEPSQPLEIRAAGWSGLAWSAWKQGRLAEARQCFERLMALGIDSPTVSDAYLPFARLLDLADEPWEAERYFKMAVAAARTAELKDVAEFQWAVLLQKRSTQEARLQAREILEKLSQSGRNAVPAEQIDYRLAWGIQETGTLEQASASYATFLQRYEHSPLWPDAAYRLAQLKSRQGLLEEASQVLQQAMSRRLPNELTARIQLLLTQIAARRGDWDHVRTVAGQLAETGSDLELASLARYWLAEAQFHSGQFRVAAYSFRRWLNDTAFVDSSLEPWAWLRLAQIELASGDSAVALEIAERSKVLFPEFMAAYEFDLVRGRALALAGEFSAAQEAYLRVLENEHARGSETAAQAQWRIGESHFHREDFVAAIAAFQLTVSEFGFPYWQAAGLLEAGKCQERLGNWLHALKLYQQLLESYPSCEFAAAAQDRIRLIERIAETDPAPIH